MKVSSIRWGVILIGIGLFFLAINLELLDSLVFPRLFSLWPILLIAIGVELLFRRTRFYFLALLSPILIAGAFIFAATANGDWKWRADEFWTRWTWSDAHRKIDTVEIQPDSAIQSLDVNLNCGPGRISLRPVSNAIFKVRAEYYKRSPWVKQDTANGIERIEYTNREKNSLALFGIRINRFKNDFELADYLPLKANIMTSDIEPDLDFSPFKLNDVTLNLNSSRVSLRIGSQSEMVNVSILGDADNFELTVPENFGMALIGDDARLRNLLRETSFLHSSDGYYSSGYNESPRKIRIDLKAKIKSLTISRD